MMSASFGTEIALMWGVRRDNRRTSKGMRTDRRTAFQLYIYDDDDMTIPVNSLVTTL